MSDLKVYYNSGGQIITASNDLREKQFYSDYLLDHKFRDIVGHVPETLDIPASCRARFSTDEFAGYYSGQSISFWSDMTGNNNDLSNVLYQSAIDGLHYYDGLVKIGPNYCAGAYAVPDASQPSTALTGRMKNFETNSRTFIFVLKMNSDVTRWIKMRLSNAWISISPSGITCFDEEEFSCQTVGTKCYSFRFSPDYLKVDINSINIQTIYSDYSVLSGYDTYFPVGIFFPSTIDPTYTVSVGDVMIFDECLEDEVCRDIESSLKTKFGI